MLTFSRLGLHGRLGNQLFQYAALKATCLRNNYLCKIPNTFENVWHGQNCLLNNFNIESEFLSKEDWSNIKFRLNVIENVPGQYTNFLENIPDNCDIIGFFQNTKYFEDHKQQIIKELTPKKQFIDAEENFLNSLRANGKKIVSLHIRRGDNVDGTNPIYHKFYGENPLDKNSIFSNYIVNALEFFDENHVILVFVGGSRSGNDDEDIKWAKKYFYDSKFVISESNDAMKDFVRISNCDDNIVSFCSTYSWWGAYINSNPNKLVIAPKNFHFDELAELRDGFYPKDWKII